MGTAPSLSVVRITCAPGVRAMSRTSGWVWLLGVDALGHDAVHGQVVDAAGVDLLPPFAFVRHELGFGMLTDPAGAPLSL